MFNDFIDGITSYFDALPLIRKFKLWPYFLIGGIVSLVIGLAVFGLAYFYADNLGDLMFSWWPWASTEHWIENISSWVAGVLIVLLSLILYKYIILIVAGPFMSILSEKVEANISNEYFEQNFSVSRMIKEAARGIRISLRNITRELFYSLLLFILSFIPGLNLITTPALFIVQAYYAGFGNLDYYLERHFNVRDSAAFVRRYKGLAIGNGTVFLAMLMIPIIGLFFAPAMATIASTLEAEERIHDWA